MEVPPLCSCRPVLRPVMRGFIGFIDSSTGSSWSLGMIDMYSSPDADYTIHGGTGNTERGRI